MSDTPIKDSLDKLGSSGEGFSLGAEIEQGKRPEVEVGFWKNLGKSWATGGAVQVAKDGWSAVYKLVWTPGGRNP